VVSGSYFKKLNPTREIKRLPRCSETYMSEISTENSTAEASASGSSEKEMKAKKGKKAETAAPVEPKVFAVVCTGGKQYRVTPGTKLSVEKLELEVGSEVTFDQVLMSGVEGGSDLKIAAAGSPITTKVTAKVVAQSKDKKVIIFKKRRRGGYTKKQGHRQKKTEVLVESISL